jgi:hypothetical protein
MYYKLFILTQITAIYVVNSYPKSVYQFNINFSP